MTALFQFLVWLIAALLLIKPFGLAGRAQMDLSV
jgi:hypothetical protein